MSTVERTRLTSRPHTIITNESQGPHAEAQLAATALYKNKFQLCCACGCLTERRKEPKETRAAEERGTDCNRFDCNNVGKDHFTFQESELLP